MMKYLDILVISAKGIDCRQRSPRVDVEYND